MSITEYYRYKIVNEISGGKDTKIVLEEYKDIGLTYYYTDKFDLSL